MKKLTIAFSLFILHSSFLILHAQTTITGPTASGHWTMAGSPYNVQNSIYIPNDSTLTIDPGVTVNFQTSFAPYLHVLGRLVAIGTLADSIYFTATDTTNGFKGIRFYGITAANDSSKLEYCKIQYAKTSSTTFPTKDGGAVYFSKWSKAVIEHCYISNCVCVNGSGAGICCDSNSNPLIIYNTIVNNSDDFLYGGGIFTNNNSTPLISNNTITDNYAGSGGGGIGVYLCENYKVLNNTISGNSAAAWAYYGGGAIYSFESKGIISGNYISGNYAYNGAGGGLYIEGDTVSILNDTILYNAERNSGWGGGITCWYTTSDTIMNCIIANNSASNGGGITLYNAGTTYISNSTILNNTAVYSTGFGNGGGIFCYATSPDILNTTIANNYAYQGGGLYCDNAATPVSRNCIYWDDIGTNAGNELFQNDQPSTPDFYYSDVDGGTVAFGLNGNFYYGKYMNNINSDPLFNAPSAGQGAGYDGISADWTLQNSSPCIDSGDPLTNPYSTTDLGGNPRIVICRIDMGAYENQYGISSPLQVSIYGTNKVCHGDSTLLTASGATTYSWSPSAGLSCTNCPNPMASPTVTTTYMVIGTTGNCQAMDTITVTVNPLPFLVIGNNLDTLKISGAKTYLWSTGSTYDTTIVHQNGTYYVTATDSNGCVAKDSIIIVSTFVAGMNNSSWVSVYPVPSNGGMHVLLNGKGYSVLKVLDELGREIYTQNLSVEKTDQNININLGNVAEGVYLLQLFSAEGVTSKHIVIQK